MLIASFELHTLKSQFLSLYAAFLSRTLVVNYLCTYFIIYSSIFRDVAFVIMGQFSQFY